jgi:hypothetical protein
LAQPYSAGSGKVESGCVGTETYASAQRARPGTRTQALYRQADTRTEIVEPVEASAFAEAVARAETNCEVIVILRIAFTQAAA